MKAAILGYGTIGSGIYEILANATSTYTSRLAVSYIYIRKGKEKTRSEMCDDIDIILNDPEVEIVAEVLGGLEPAHTLILRALKAGKHVVTANKLVTAAYLQEFLDTARENNVQFLFEATTGGGIPWIRSVDKVKRIDAVSDFHGIFNGTTNYILDHMYKDDKDFDEVLKKAQELGYAERDPAADIDGIDISNKLQITASLAFDCIAPDDFPVFGIRHIIREDVRYFKEKGKVLKLIAESHCENQICSCSVEPVAFEKYEMEASVPENFNLASVTGTTIGELKFYGQGAGKLATANAVVQDMIDIMEGEEAQAYDFSKHVEFEYNLVIKNYVLRTTAKEEDIKEIFGEHVGEVETYESLKYYAIHKISTLDMHNAVKKLQKKDSKAFFCRLSVE